MLHPRTHHQCHPSTTPPARAFQRSTVSQGCRAIMAHHTVRPSNDVVRSTVLGSSPIAKRTRGQAPLRIKPEGETTLSTQARTKRKTTSNARKRKLSEFQDVQKQETSTPMKPQAAVISKDTISPVEKKKKPKKTKDEEKRLRMFRKQATLSFREKLYRAQTQRMVVIGRTRKGTEGCPEEDIDIVGSTGNIYRVTIAQCCSCTCPDSQKGNECKHKVYALNTVLKAPEHLQYQLALLSSGKQRSHPTMSYVLKWECSQHVPHA